MEQFTNILFILLGIIIGGFITWLIGKHQLSFLLRQLKGMIMDREEVTLNEEFLLTHLLYEKIRKDEFIPDIIYAISPGGCMISEWLSRAFLGDYKNPICVKTICIRTERSEGGVKTKRAFVSEDPASTPKGLDKENKVLLLNDISRGGNTLQVAYDFLIKKFSRECIVTATLITHVDASTKPKFYSLLTDKTIRFDWKHTPLS